MGTAVTLGSSGLIATEYLLRYYALGGRLVREGEPIQLDTSLAAVALEEYLQQLPVAVNIAGEWWNDAVKQFECGNLAMLIMYLNLFNDVAHTTIAPTIGYAPVPGQLPQLGGGSIGMSRYSKKKKQTRITGMDNQILALYARGMTTREITSVFKEMYDADVSPALISKVTDAVID